ncbi:MAG: TadE/TadG family type IV pilus assembly protein [Chloroflexota bacterium]
MERGVTELPRGVAPVSRVWRILRRWRAPREAGSGARGQSLLELAILIPLLILLLLGAIDAGRVFYFYTGVANATRAGGTYAINARNLRLMDDATRLGYIRQSVVDEIANQVPAVTVDDVTVSVPGGVIAQGGEASVSVTYSFELLIPFDRLWGQWLTFTYASTVRFA